MVLPVPLEGMPVKVPDDKSPFVLVHENVVPATVFGLVIVTVLMSLPEQIFWLADPEYPVVGIGFTGTTTS